MYGDNAAYLSLDFLLTSHRDIGKYCRLIYYGLGIYNTFTMKRVLIIKNLTNEYTEVRRSSTSLEAKYYHVIVNFKNEVRMILLERNKILAEYFINDKRLVILRYLADKLNFLNLCLRGKHTNILIFF